MTELPWNDSWTNFVTPDRSKAVILQLAEDTANPEYLVFGKATCDNCRKWCWLGSETLQAVNSGRFAPLCQPCAATIVEPRSIFGLLRDEV